ncbi:carbon storage regulator CsrA [Paenibacillus sp. GCM10012307]|uniref:Translational regulator CsrA n=1 Tax=Paenibacillus roseus TaxID=2798579 RepID=A0A934MPC4_9BACL|nr:carbon storage regulator CsrA [Paenibacillus roseus]MBJ6361931.1 carbon storage regulator CsrA [Paenibacillus roseus]
MLVLSRKADESIMIGEQIEVVVLGMEGDVVKLGIRAPKQVDIYRKELYVAIQASNREAVQRQPAIGQLTGLLKKQPAAENIEKK